MALFNRKKNETVRLSPEYKMMTSERSGFFSFDGHLYKSDLVRAAIRPQVSSVGKLVAKHIRRSLDEEGRDSVEVNPWIWMKFLLKEPNPYMTGQDMQEKLATDLILNGNAFALIVRDPQELPAQLYPIPARSVRPLQKDGRLQMEFTVKGNKKLVVNYGDLIHLKGDYGDDFLMGSSPAQAISELMEMATVMDQGLIKAIKNSGVVRWLLKFLVPLKPEDLKANVKNFTENYLSYSSDTMGAAGIDAKTEATQVSPNDYVPNADIQEHVYTRVKNFFSTNDAIIQSRASEEEWTAYYEQVIEPIALKMSNEFTRKLFTRRQQGFGNEILFESMNLEHVSMEKKINLGVQMVDRGAMSVNEWRSVLNLAPVPEGDVFVRRLDTAPITQEGDRDDNSN